jgi:hypothetical protein
MADFTISLAEFRRQRYAPAAARITTSQDALAFIKRAGYCLLSPRRRLDLPSLAEFADGSARRWKDAIVKSQEIYYGRPFRRRSGFVRLDLLPSLYALSPTADFGGDRFELYKRRFLSADANRIAGIVLAKGPLPTRALRRESGWASHAQRDRFLRRLAEAESRFLIVKSALTTVEASHYSYLWESFEDFYPRIIEQSREMTVDAAATRVMTSYLDIVGAASIRQIAALFTLNEVYVRLTADRLVADDLIATHVDQGRELLISHELQSWL